MILAASYRIGASSTGSKHCAGSKHSTAQKMMKFSALVSQFLGATASRRLPELHCSSWFLASAKAGTATFTESFHSEGFSPNPNSPFVNRPDSVWGQSSRIYASHSFFKDNAALCVQPKGPVFSAMDSGGIKLSKEGCIFFMFAPAVGVRQYDWSRKQIFALSVLEIGTLLSLGPKESCEFLHDPFMRKSEEGKIQKVLKVVPSSESPGYFFGLGVSNKILNVDEHVHIRITKSEFAVMQSAFNFILPHLMGWNAITGSRQPVDAVGPVHVISDAPF